MNRQTHITLVTLLFAGVSFGSIDQAKAVAGPQLFFELLALNKDIGTPVRSKYLSPSTLKASSDGQYMYIGVETGKQVVRFNLASKSVDKTYTFPNNVSGCTVTHDGSQLIVTCSSELWPAGKIYIVNPDDGAKMAIIAAGNGVRAPVVTPDGKKLYVCNQFDHDVNIINLTTLMGTSRIPVGREPYSSAISPDGKLVLIGNLHPFDRATDTTSIASVVSVISTATDLAVGIVRLQRGDVAIHGITVSPDNKYAFIAHRYDPFNLLSSTVTGGWGGKAILTIVDLATKTTLNRVCLDNPNEGKANPWAVTCSNDGKFIAVTHAGTNEISIIDLPALIDSATTYAKNKIDMGSSFNVLDNIRVIRTATSTGPRAVEIIGENIFTIGYFNETPQLEQQLLTIKPTASSLSYPIGRQTTLVGERKGEALFYDARTCFQGWRSCHSCHTFGRSGVLNKILGGGTIGIPKNIKSLVNSWWTPPTTWGGRRENAMQSVIGMIQMELFVSSSPSVSLPLDTFLMHMKPAVSPYREKGNLSASALRGKAIFNGDNGSCFTCHPAPLFTDNKMHSPMIEDVFGKENINTPSLVECWRTAPYSHLGSMLDVNEMISQPGHRPKASLSNQEMLDLCTYVLSL